VTDRCAPRDEKTVVTVGHGTLDADRFGALLTEAGVQTLVDVRRHPGSRRFPHFGTDALQRWLPSHAIDYLAIASLGGRRRPSSDVTNAAWRNPQFRAYADHMATPEFVGGVELLMTAHSSRTVAVMCSEAVWWRCHRRLLADHLELIERVPVVHLFHDGRLSRHAPTPEARVEGPRVVYPAP
jgi:uncharacterized protein (DUF488 family)